MKTTVLLACAACASSFVTTSALRAGDPSADLRASQARIAAADAQRMQQARDAGVALQNTINATFNGPAANAPAATSTASDQEAWSRHTNGRWNGTQSFPGGSSGGNVAASTNTSTTNPAPTQTQRPAAPDANSQATALVNKTLQSGDSFLPGGSRRSSRNGNDSSGESFLPTSGNGRSSKTGRSGSENPPESTGAEQDNDNPTDAGENFLSTDGKNASPRLRRGRGVDDANGGAPLTGAERRELAEAQKQQTNDLRHAEAVANDQQEENARINKKYLEFRKLGLTDSRRNPNDLSTSEKADIVQHIDSETDHELLLDGRGRKPATTSTSLLDLDRP